MILLSFVSFRFILYIFFASYSARLVDCSGGLFYLPKPTGRCSKDPSRRLLNYILQLQYAETDSGERCSMCRYFNTRKKDTKIVQLMVHVRHIVRLENENK